MLNLIHSFRNSWLDSFFRNITHIGSLYFVLSATVVLVLLLMHFKNLNEAKMLLTSVVATIVLSHVVKLFFKRPRPDINPPVIPMPVDWSFPSAHTAQITVLSLCLGIFAFRFLPMMPAWGVCSLALLMIGIVGFSRMYLQVHYPTDVAAGFVLAAIIVAISFIVFKN